MLLSAKAQQEMKDEAASDGEGSRRMRRTATGEHRSRFATWRRERPFVGGLLIAIAGVEMFFSGQLDIGHLHVQLGIEGLQATVIPVLLLLLGVLAVLMPAHHIFYGVLSLAIAVYAIVGVNLGGFLIGTILACIGGVLVVAWMTPEARARSKAEAASRKHRREEPVTGESE